MVKKLGHILEGSRGEIASYTASLSHLIVISELSIELCKI